MRKLLLVLVIFVVLVVAGMKLVKMEKVTELMEERVTQSDKELLLPDIKMLSPKELGIRSVGDKKALRFSTTFVNEGEGALELFGHHDEESKITYAAQYIYEVGGPGEYRQVGEFVFHPDHDHWHVDDYVYYELWSVEQDNLKEKLRETDKMSFCIWDEHTHDLEIENASQSRVYTWPCVSGRQGMSVGWGDTYLARVEGQEIDITGIPDGEYIFRSFLNPEKRIVEGNYDNNEDRTRIEIRGNTVIRK